MYREGYFYGIIDILKYNVTASLFKDKIIKEENGIIEVFKKNREEIVIESVNGKETIIKDTRRNKNKDITEYDLVYLKSFNRYYLDYEIKGMVYVNIDNNCYYRVKIDGYDPKDARIRPIYLKDVSINSDNKYLYDFIKISNGIRFVRPSKIKKYLNSILN